jgi:hypothetical protein
MANRPRCDGAANFVSEFSALPTSLTQDVEPPEGETSGRIVPVNGENCGSDNLKSGQP